MKLSKSKRRKINATAANAAAAPKVVPPVTAEYTDADLKLNEAQQMLCCVAVREGQLELLGMLINYLTHLREEVA